LNGLFDPEGKTHFQKPGASAIQTAFRFIQMDIGNGTAFPPQHARYFAHKYLPADTDGVIVDPCAGWGGRLVGSLLSPIPKKVTYYGIDPEIGNSPAYDGLTSLITKDLKDELWGPREAVFAYAPFEDWLKTEPANELFGKVDLVMSSPPYGCAEIYNANNPDQSSSRYPRYLDWKSHFLQPTIEGAYNLLRPGGHLVWNVANTKEARTLEEDSCEIARRSGLRLIDTYNLAMSVMPGLRGKDFRKVSVDGTVFKVEPVFCFKRTDSKPN
jgi:hypothetical protein